MNQTEKCCCCDNPARPGSIFCGACINEPCRETAATREETLRSSEWVGQLEAAVEKYERLRAAAEPGSEMRGYWWGASETAAMILARIKERGRCPTDGNSATDSDERGMTPEEREALDAFTWSELRDGEEAVRWSEWVESSRGQALAYRREDNGDRSEWSIYNRGRADALETAIEGVRRLLSTVAHERDDEAKPQ